MLLVWKCIIYWHPSSFIDSMYDVQQPFVFPTKCRVPFNNVPVQSCLLYIVTNDYNWYILGTAQFFLYHIYEALKRIPLMTYKEKKWCYKYRTTFLLIFILRDLTSLYFEYCINIAPRVLRNILRFRRNRTSRPLT